MLRVSKNLILWRCGKRQGRLSGVSTHLTKHRTVNRRNFASKPTGQLVMGASVETHPNCIVSNAVMDTPIRLSSRYLLRHPLLQMSSTPPRKNNLTFFCKIAYPFCRRTIFLFLQPKTPLGKEVLNLPVLRTTLISSI